jgi:hypothetical protein
MSIPEMTMLTFKQFVTELAREDVILRGVGDSPPTTPAISRLYSL